MPCPLLLYPSSLIKSGYNVGFILIFFLNTSWANTGQSKRNTFSLNLSFQLANSEFNDHPLHVGKLSTHERGVSKFS